VGTFSCESWQYCLLVVLDLFRIMMGKGQRCNLPPLIFVWSQWFSLCWVLHYDFMIRIIASHIHVVLNCFVLIKLFATFKFLLILDIIFCGFCIFSYSFYSLSVNKDVYLNGVTIRILKNGCMHIQDTYDIKLCNAWFIILVCNAWFDMS
jgi:hypothetical protein